MIWKWFCFILIVSDVFSWLRNVIDNTKNITMVIYGKECIGAYMGIILGVIARGYFLFHVAQYWFM